MSVTRLLHLTLSLLCCLWLLSTPNNSHCVTLEWDVSECAGGCAPYGVDGYIVYWGSEQGVYPNSQDVGNILKVTLDIPDGSYIVVTGYNEIGESEYSDEFFYNSEQIPIAAVVTQATKFQEEGALMAVAVENVYSGTMLANGNETTITNIDLTDCNACVVLVSHENGSSGGVHPTIAELCFDSGDTLDFDFSSGTVDMEEFGSNYNHSGVTAHVITSDDSGWPGAASGKTLTLQYAAAFDHNPKDGKVAVITLSGVDTSDPMNNTIFQDNSGEDNSNVTHTLSGITRGADDYSFLISYYWGGTPSTSQTEHYDSASGGSEQSLYVAGVAGNNTLATSGLDYPITLGIAVNAGAGVSDLSIDTNQQINISESISGQLSVAGINIFENINLTESVTISDLLLNLEINIAQQIELSESVSGFLSLAGITVDETINISESITSFLSVAGISVADNIEIAENITPAVNLGAISINETLELAEALTSGVPLGFEKFENITLGEFLSLLESIAPSRFENITVTEYLALLKDIGLSEFENITINEQITAALTQTGLNIFDTLSVGDFVSILKDIGIDTAQQITISEVTSAIVSLAGIDKSENLTVSEVLALLLSLSGIDTAQNINIVEFVNGILSVAGIDVAENITISELVTLIASGDLPITDAAENITITEAITILFNFLPISEAQNINIIESVTAALATTGIDVSETINISEYAILILSLGLIDVSDSVTVSEAITALLETTGANVYDTISVNEFILSILDVTGIDVSQSITISEFVYVTMVTVAGLLRVNFSVRKPGINYAARKPKITFN